jgi:hypothetical protein
VPCRLVGQELDAGPAAVGYVVTMKGDDFHRIMAANVGKPAL